MGFRNLITIALVAFFVAVFVLAAVLYTKFPDASDHLTTAAAGALVVLVLVVILRIIIRVLKYNLEKHPPRTIIGKNYSWAYLNRANQRQGATPKIQRGNDDEEAGEVVSVAYGPIHREREDEMWKARKEEAWNHVLNSSSSSIRAGVNVVDLDKKEATKSLYMEAVKKVEAKARALYDTQHQQSLTSSEFQMMMVIDGCFLLQVALFVLDGYKELNYPSDHRLFGKVTDVDQAEIRRRSKMFKDAVSSMFVVGNQIPLVVLKALMQQRFFKDVINRGMWEQPLDLKRWTLFELLVAPMLHVRLGGRAVSIPTTRLSKYSPFRAKPFRFLVDWALWLFRSAFMLLRFVTPFLAFCLWRKLYRVQKLSKRSTDLLHGMWLLTTAGLDEYSHRIESKDMYREDDRSNHYSVVLRTVRSATELKAAGIKFYYQDGRMINGITLHKFMFTSFLILPRIFIDSNKASCALHNLIRYELKHIPQSKRAVCEYVQLMRELVRSPEDAKHLVAEGIIVLDPDLDEQKLPDLLKDFSFPTVRNHRSQISIARNKLHHRTRPSRLSKSLGYLVNIIVLLTAIQTFYTVISYYKKENAGPPSPSPSPGSS